MLYKPHAVQKIVPTRLLRLPAVAGDYDIGLKMKIIRLKFWKGGSTLIKIKAELHVGWIRIKFYTPTPKKERKNDLKKKKL